MTLFWILLATGVLFRLLMFVLALARKRGYQSGRQDGYDEGYTDGKRDEGKWWVDVEYQVTEMRKRIGAEEGWP